MAIDLNTVEEEEEDEGSSAAASVCLELWHACAGPMVSLPRKGSLVVYFPQGHAEHLSNAGGHHHHRLFCRYDIPPHVFCRVVALDLRADGATDEVYAQLSLVAAADIGQEASELSREGRVENEEEGENGDGGRRSLSPMPHMFCKTLTASDTSTHGGLSVPRRAAEDCFPVLDYMKQRPSQEIVAKDLHGIEWRFRHIYRGQPRRHLLTTGWSAFINKKKLVSGDAVLFLRGDDGVLRLGVRRAAQLKNDIPYSMLCGHDSNSSTLAEVANALSKRSVFRIYYNPRASWSGFIIPYWKFMRSLSHSFSVGMRFKMQFENDDTAERRYTGLITGIAELDPVRWAGSKWRCLMVRWDDDVETSKTNRISPWEIESIGSVSGSTGLQVPGSKRTKICLPSVSPDTPVPNRSGYPDLEESSRFHKVLQGQEIMRFSSPYSGIDATTSPVSEIRNHQYPERCTTDSNSGMFAGQESVGIVPTRNSESYNCTGFGGTLRFHKVLQGQENSPFGSSYRETPFGAQSENCVDGLLGIMYASGGGRIKGYGSLVESSSSSAPVLSPSSVMFQQTDSQFLFPQSVDRNDRDKGYGCSYFRLTDCPRMASGEEEPLHCQPRYMVNELKERFDLGKVHAQLQNDKNVTSNSFRLFGFPLLSEKNPAMNIVDDTQSSTPKKMDYATSSHLLSFTSPRNLVGTVALK